MPQYPLVVSPEPIPSGEVETAILQRLVSKLVERDIDRNDVLNVRIRRTSAQAPNSRHSTIEVRFEPSGSEAPRGAKRCTFGDFVRMAAVLSFTTTMPYLRACVWISLGDPYIGGLVRKAREQIALALADKRFAWLRKPQGTIADNLGSNLSVAVTASGGEEYFVFVPLDDTANVHLIPTTWDDRQADAGAYLNVGRIVICALTEWDRLTPAERNVSE